MSCCRPFTLPSVKALDGSLVPIPCGHCLSCRLDKIIMWSNRLTSEYIKSSSAFVTLTYDDYHLKFNRGFSSPTLDKKDLHLFFDRLRHYLKRVPSSSRSSSDFKYFACGEYGDKFGRPHYHVLFFGLDFAECRKVLMTEWKNGSVKVLPMFSGSIRYVLKYLEKAQTKDFVQSNFLDFGIIPPFTVCSHGLGRDWFFSHADDINKYGLIRVGSRFIPVPPYYKNLVYNYSDSLVNNLKDSLVSKNKDLYSVSRDLGFNSVENYLSYSRKAKERTLLARSRFNCSSAFDYLSEVS